MNIGEFQVSSKVLHGLIGQASTADHAKAEEQVAQDGELLESVCQKPVTESPPPKTIALSDLLADDGPFDLLKIDAQG